MPGLLQLAVEARKPRGAVAVCAAAFALICLPVAGQEQARQPDQTLVVTVGKSLVIDSPLAIERLSMANGDLADAVAIGPNEVVINGKAPGETSLIVWQVNGARLVYDLTVNMSSQKLEAARQQISREFPNESIELTFDNDAAFVRGTVRNTIAAERVMAIAGTLGKAVNLLNVDVPPVEAQVLVKVRFANVDHSVSSDLGASLSSTAFNQWSSTSTDGLMSVDGLKTMSLSDAVNIFLFRRDINLAAAIKALESKSLLEMLAEPTVPAINGKEASFVAGGEFPFPMVQPSAGGAVLTLSWREYGVRLNFLPVITPRGTIRLQVAPEVSSLDYTHAVSVMGYTIPGISTRRVKTEIELEDGQSFVIAGLIDNQARESLQKIPGIGDIPIIGRLFQSKTINRSNGELLVIVTPEIVRPIPEGQPLPELKFPITLLPPNTPGPVKQPGMEQTGPVPVTPSQKTIPLEQLLRQEKQGQPNSVPSMPQFQLVPMQAAQTDAGTQAGSSR